MTGLPEPQVATHAVGMPATPRSIRKPSFSSRPVRYLDGLHLLKAQLGEAEDGIDHDLRLVFHLVDLAGDVGFDGRGPIDLAAPPCGPGCTAIRGRKSFILIGTHQCTKLNAYALELEIRGGRCC